MPDGDESIARPRSVFQAELPAPCNAAWDWHARPGAFERLVPPFDPVRLVSSSGTIEEGDSKVLAVPPLGLRWVARHGRAVRGALFVDRQERGPFASFVHHHRFTPLTSEFCLLSDELDWRLPLEPASRWLAGGFVRSKLARMFAWRHHVVVHDLAMARALAIAPLHLDLACMSRARAQVAAFIDSQGHVIVAQGGRTTPAPSIDARLRLADGLLVVEPRRGGTIQFHCGDLVLDRRDLRHGGAWTLLEDLVAAALLAAAGRLADGPHSLVRHERQLASTPLAPLVLDGIELPLRWRSMAELEARLGGRVRAGDPRPAPVA